MKFIHEAPNQAFLMLLFGVFGECRDSDGDDKCKYS